MAGRPASCQPITSTAPPALVEEFRRARQEDYASLAREIERTVGVTRAVSRSPRSRRGEQRPIQTFRQRLAAIERMDFFNSAGRDRVVALIDRMAERALPARSGDPHSDAGRPRGTYRARLRVTRPRPGVDRMASAWLIRRFIDRDAAFSFVRDREKAPQDAVPFDMFGVEFGHRDTNCTFETLCDVVAIADPAVVRVAAVVHDLNPKTAQFRAAETATIGALIEGLRLAHADDQELLEVGMTLVESLYQTFEQASKRPRPRQVARAASNPQAPLALTRADALFRTKIHSHGESDGARISWQANNQPGVARLRRQEFVVLLVQQIARPEEHRPALVPAEARTQVDQAVAVDHHVARG